MDRSGGDLAGCDFNVQRGHVGSDLAADAAEDGAEAMDGASLEEGVHVFCFAEVGRGQDIFD